MKFFKTVREKEFVLKRAKRGNFLPFFKYALYRLKLSGIFSTKRKHYSLRISYTPLAFWLWTHQATPKSDELFYESFLTPGDIVIDCGAHIGTLTLTASSIVGNTGKVIACEMHPRTFRYLTSNVEANGRTNVELYNVAIGDKNEGVLVTDEYVSDINHVSHDGALSVPMTTIDYLAKDIPRIDLLKLDVEGYELQALRGAQETLPRIKAIYFEAAPRSFARYNYTLKDIFLFLKGRGFRFYAFDQGGEKVPIDENFTPEVKYENILAVH